MAEQKGRARELFFLDSKPDGMLTALGLRLDRPRPYDAPNSN